MVIDVRKGGQILHVCGLIRKLNGCVIQLWGEWGLNWCGGNDYEIELSQNRYLTTNVILFILI